MTVKVARPTQHNESQLGLKHLLLKLESCALIIKSLLLFQGAREGGRGGGGHSNKPYLLNFFPKKNTEH